MANYHPLLRNTYVSLASGIFRIKPIWTHSGPERAESLPAFHAFSGSDNTGCFSSIGKATWLKIYLKTDDTFLQALRLLSQTSQVTEELQSTLAKLVCIPYSSNGVQIDEIPELRWHLFCKNLAESDKLPPTFRALKQQGSETTGLMFRQGTGVKQILLNKNLSTLYLMATTKTRMEC